ncbi:FAD-dependent monooxygenase [Streptomyces griseosporeus]|uniref:FAD-dependent monooxygenase n=1 Tax=Streptomyces griseosporeus TaxID=1910 RepID=UPI00167D56DD|nr:FAD-dependent monooxygenase [Streptomyces griseosporeus]GHF55918.1 FAD-dependent oxidoreductase [Streptomyces griseosporeus]
MRQVPVLIVGGSLTGLSAALFLTAHGVPVTVVERRPTVLAHPRLRGLLPRTMELYRQAGLEPDILAVCPPGVSAGHLPSVHAPTLADEHELLGDTGGDSTEAELSPCAFVPIGQHELEGLLVERLRERDCELCFGTEASGLVPDEDGVTVLLHRPDGTAETVRARWLVAADGASGAVRRRLGIAVHGPGTLFRMATTHVEADLDPALRGRPVGMAYLDRPAPGTTLGPLDASGQRWFFATALPPDAPVAEEDLLDRLRVATGLPDLRARLLPQGPGLPPVMAFPVGARVAERFTDGRVLLAGDAAHLMPPTGSLGGHTGVEDAHNLAWKLAAVLHGGADPALLDTYDAERRPVAERNAREAHLRARARWRLPGHESDARLTDMDRLLYGGVYRSSAVPGTSPPPGPDPPGRLPAPDPLDPRALGGVPGTRAPHVTVSQDGAEPVSTLDLYGRGPVVLVGPDGDTWATAAERAAKALGVPVEVYHLDTDLSAPHGLGARGALLVRPDGYVAWRAAGGPARAEDADAVFAAVLAAVLGRPAVGSP